MLDYFKQSNSQEGNTQHPAYTKSGDAPGITPAKKVQIRSQYLQQLRELQKLCDEGTLTCEEFAEEKEHVLCTPARFMLLSYLVMHFLHFGIAFFIRRFDKGIILAAFPDHVVRVHIYTASMAIATSYERTHTNAYSEDLCWKSLLRDLFYPT